MTAFIENQPQVSTQPDFNATNNPADRLPPTKPISKTTNNNENSEPVPTTNIAHDQLPNSSCRNIDPVQGHGGNKPTLPLSPDDDDDDDDKKSSHRNMDPSMNAEGHGGNKPAVPQSPDDDKTSPEAARNIADQQPSDDRRDIVIHPWELIGTDSEDSPPLSRRNDAPTGQHTVRPPSYEATTGDNQATNVECDQPATHYQIPCSNIPIANQSTFTTLGHSETHYTQPGSEVGVQQVQDAKDDEDGTPGENVTSTKEQNQRTDVKQVWTPSSPMADRLRSKDT